MNDTTEAISTRVGPLMESFTRRTGDIVAQNAGGIDGAESQVTDSITGVTRTGGDGVAPGDVHPGAGPEPPGGSGAAGTGTHPGDLAPPQAPAAVPGPTAPAPVDTQGVGPCGKAGEPVDVVSGQYVTAAVDVDLPGVLPLVLRRAYASGYRGGRLLGPGWSSTLDIRVQITRDAVYFADDDCRILEFPVPDPAAAARPVLPAAGERLELTWDRERDEIRIQNPVTGRTWHFTTIGATRVAGTGPDDDAPGSVAGTEIRPLTAISDRNGNRIVFTRDQDGLPTEVTRSGGYRVAVDTGYTAAGFRVEALHLVHPTDPDRTSMLTAYQFDLRGRMIGLIGPTDVAFEYEYDTADRITAWTDRTGYRFAYRYDDLGRVTATDGDGGYLSGTFAYDPGNRTTAYTDSLGHTTEYRYDDRGHVTTTVDALGHSTLTEYDPYGRLVSRTDELGHATRVSVDDAGDPVRIDRPDGTSVSARYDARHQPIEMTDPSGEVWRYTRDDRGNLLAATDPLGHVTAFSYDERGILLSRTDALGQVTRYVSDRAGLPLSATDPAGATWTATRDPQGRVLSSTDPLGASTVTTWDGAGHPVSRTHPDGCRETWTWDANGSLLAHTDRSGRSTAFEVGPFRRVVARTGPDGARHTFVHDTELRLTTVTDPQNLIWSYTYDERGNPTGERDFNGRALTYGYDAAGRMERRTNAVGRSVELVRDGAGRVVAQHCDDGSVTSFGYDRLGHLVRAAGPDCDLAVIRDPLGRVLAETAGGRTLTSTYDPLGRRLTRITPTGRVSRWQYDDRTGRPLTLTSGARQISFGHDPAGRETHRRIGPDTALTSVRDDLGRLTARRVIGADGPSGAAAHADSAAAQTARLLHERTWTYHADGSPETISDLTDGLRRLDVDVLGRVTAVNSATWTERYAYDEAGNLTHAEDTRDPDAPTGGPRVLTGLLLREAGRTRYEYDAQGRVIKMVRRTLSGQHKVWTYQYDAYDRLIEAVNAAGEHWRYQYDPLGRRIGKRRFDEDGATVEEVRFTWDGTVLAEQDHYCGKVPTVTAVGWDHEPGTWTPVTQDTRTFYAAAPQEVIDQAFHAVITDLVGAPTELVDPDDGRTVWRRRTGLWGATIPENPAAAPTDDGRRTGDCPLRFPGQYHDAETGLDYNYQRYYDPGTGRYTTADPLGLVPAPNHYAYVENPLRLLDPFGLAGGPPPGGRPAGPISMDTAVSLGADFVGDNARIVRSGSGGFQFLSTGTDPAGDTVTGIARFDINPASPHVQGLGPHLNLETQVNGTTVRSGPLADPHISIDPATIRPGDIPCP
ncbi:MAG TPA: DUF6531 domain-containing protein [Actinocrinis sp.]|nr:DUF6531 domain-containing protein [Actinocrinis sp.]